MKKNLTIFSLCSLIASLGIFGFSYALFHHLSADGCFTREWLEEPTKPLVTELFAILGVLFLFTGLVSLLVRLVFFRDGGEKKDE